MSFNKNLEAMGIPKGDIFRFEKMADNYQWHRQQKQQLQQQIRDHEADRKRCEKQIKRFMVRHGLTVIKNNLKFMPDFYYTKHGMFCFQEERP